MHFKTSGFSFTLGNVFKTKVSQVILIFLATCLGLFVHLSHKMLVSPSAKPLESQLLTLEGKFSSLDDWGGKTRVVNFWATWCPPCLREIPLLIDFQKTMGQNKVQVIGISIDDVVKLREFVAKSKINYPVLLGGGIGIDLSFELGNTSLSIPYTVVLDQKGSIIAKIPGEIDEGRIQELKVTISGQNSSK